MASKSVEKRKIVFGSSTRSFLYLLAIFLLIGCTSSSCRKPLRSYPKTVEEPTPKTSLEDAGQENATVFVYKYDGSLQCQPGTAVPLQEMEKELAGVKVLAKEKRRDGLMHIQACGAKTGIANVYKIRFRDQGLAEEKGFRVWDFK